jgi:hypothetical protein
MIRRSIAYLLLLCSTVAMGQFSPLKPYYDRVYRKLALDEEYSTVRRITFANIVLPPGLLKDVELVGADGRRMQFKSAASGPGKSSNFLYQLYYLPPRDPFEPPQPIRLVEKREFTTFNPYGGTQTDVAETEFLLEDFLALRRNAEGTYGLLQKFILDRDVAGLADTLGAKIYRPRPQQAYAVVDNNRDYINYARVNDRYPFGDIDRENRPFSLDATFSSLTLSHKLFYAQESAIGIHGFGIEAGFPDRFINHISFQTPAVYWGGRFLLFFHMDNELEIREGFFVDLKVLGRTPVNSAKFINENLGILGPFVRLDPPKINVNRGAAVEINTGSPFNSRLPFIHFAYAGGWEEYEQPFVTFTQDDRQKAYYANRSWEASMAFFWNLDEDLFNRLRLELGAGTYEILLVEYSEPGKVATFGKLRSMSQVQPLLGIDYTHVSTRATFGVRFRFFENRPTFMPWLKVFHEGLHEVRFEAAILTGPVGRGLREWEVQKGSVIQLRYRYGF